MTDKIANTCAEKAHYTVAAQSAKKKKKFSGNEPGESTNISTGNAVFYRANSRLPRANRR